jgi:hypothetical protein
MVTRACPPCPTQLRRARRELSQGHVAQVRVQGSVVGRRAAENLRYRCLQVTKRVSYRETT